MQEHAFPRQRHGHPMPVGSGPVPVSRAGAPAAPEMLLKALSQLVSYPVAQLVGMLNFDLMYPLLESCSVGEESYGSHASVAEVFMASTPPRRTDNTMCDPTADGQGDAAHYTAAGGGGGAEAQTVEA